MIMRSLTWLLLGAFLVTSCSSDAEGAQGRLAVVDNGDVVVMDPDGGNRIAVTASPDTGPERAFYFQPTWSPDATLLAFSEISPATRLHITTPGENTSASARLDSLPFYLSWSDTNVLATLRNGSDGLRLEKTTRESIEDGLTLVDEGAPLYFSWEPGGERLARLLLDGACG